MALKAGRVGVATSEVDEFGHITGGGTPENVYTKSQCDNKFELKSHIGGLKFRDNDGTAQYMLPNGEWTNFNSGGGEALGFNIPEDLITDDYITLYNATKVSGGYYIDSSTSTLYIDVVIQLSSSSCSLAISNSSTGYDVYDSDHEPNKSLCVDNVGSVSSYGNAKVAGWSSGFGFSMNGGTNDTYRVYGTVKLRSTN